MHGKGRPPPCVLPASIAWQPEVTQRPTSPAGWLTTGECLGEGGRRVVALLVHVARASTIRCHGYTDIPAFTPASAPWSHVKQRQCVSFRGGG